MKILITGANKGIGFALANRLGKSGHELFIGARNVEKGKAAVTQLMAQGISAHFIQLDLNQPENFPELLNQLPELDLLINNAGIPDRPKANQPALDLRKSTFDYETEDLRQTMAVNFFGTHALIQTLLPKILEAGKIVNITIPIMPTAHWHPLAYQTSKAALNVMTMAYAYEFEQMKSLKQCFGIMPGAVATDLNGLPLRKGSFVKSPEQAAETIARIIFDGQNHNGQMVQYDGKIVSSYERDLF